MSTEVKVHTESLRATNKASSGPVQKYRAGAITATIWANEATTKSGENTAFYTVKVERNYKDKNEAWQSTSSFRLNDLPRVELVAHKAYEWLALNEN